MRWVYAVGLAGIAVTFLVDGWLDIDYRIAANVSLVYIATLTTAFVLLYGLRSNWRANHIGRIFFAKAVVLPMVLWQIVASVWGDTEYPFRQQIRFLIYSLGALAYLAMVASLWHEQRGDRRRRARERDKASVEE
jgi:hypothetical protein